MTEGVSLLLEGCCFLMILNQYHGATFRFTIRTLLLLLAEVGTLLLINWLSAPAILELCIIPAAVWYVHREYAQSCLKAGISVFVSLFLLGVLQLSVGIFAGVLLKNLDNVLVLGLVINAATFFIIMLFGVGKRAAEVSQKESSFIKAAGIYLIVVFIYMLAIYKLRSYFTLTETVLLMAMFILTVLLVAGWKKERQLSLEKDKGLRLQYIYDHSYEALLADVRSRQHEFKNHITAIKGLSYTCKTYEELITAQREYCDIMLEENKYNELLYTCPNPVLNGFLYNKFREAQEQHGIKIEFHIAMDWEKNKRIEIFDLIEMIGILFDNAAEALQDEGNKEIKVHLQETEEAICIEVLNASRKIPIHEIDNFFKKEYTTKGSGRGIGLKKIKQLKKKYNGKIEAGNIELDGRNYLRFKVIIFN